MSTELATRNPQPVARAALLFCVPESDQDEFRRLPEGVQEEVDKLLVEFDFIHRGRFETPKRKVKQALEELSRRLVRHLKRGSRASLFGFGTLRNKFYLYVEGGKTQTGEYAPGDWRCLVNWAKCTAQQRGSTNESDVNLPKDFIEFLKGLMQSNKRKSEPAIRKLYLMWRAGDAIPGYGTWQEWFMDLHPHDPLPTDSSGRPVCPPDMPKGWSKSNLRRYIPEDAELALAREGISSAKSLLPNVITTREGLRPLECIMFDDVRTDFKILVPDYASPVEINLLVAFDVATGMVLRFGLRPGIVREDGMRDKLKLNDMKHLVAGILSQYGVPRDYVMHFVVENATAALKDGTIMALKELSCNRIAVSRTMMIRGTAIWGGYVDKSLGNPNGKAPLESLFNLFHNEAAFLPGQTGRRYDEGPRELAGREDEAKQLMRVARHLDPLERARLKLPFLTRDQARTVIAHIWNLIIRRTDHCMEGFQPVGEWREAKHQQWRPDHELSTLDPRPSGIEWRTPARLESPFERWNRLVMEVGGANAFSKLHPGAVMRLYDDHAKKEIICGEIIFKLKNEQFVYRAANVQHARSPLQNEREVLCYFDREDMSMIHLTDGEGGYLGSIPRTRGARRLDKAAVEEQFKFAKEQRRKLQETVSKRMPHVAEEHLEAIENNNTVMAEAAAKMQSIDLVPGNGSDGVSEAPPVAEDLLRAKLQQQLNTRAAADAAQEKAEITPPAPVPDCTQELLASESETAPGENEW